MSAILQRAVEQLCREVDALRARVEALEASEVDVDAEERIKQALRAQAAVAIIEASEVDVDAEVLAKMLAADGGTPPREILKWLRTVAVRGEGDSRHPLFPYLTSKKPLCFGKKSLADALGTVGQ